MKADRIALLLVVLGVLSLCGCNHPTSQPAAQQPAPPRQPAAPQLPAKPEPPAPPPQPAVPAPSAAPQKAGVGVGEKGRGYGQGVVATPAATLFAAKERIVFEMEVPKAMQLFKAMEGRGPKDHAEYMDKIIKANQIRLPELPQGKQYRYDPKTELLMVE